MGASVNINKWGLRDEKDLEKTKDSIRIALIGDSFIFGWGVEYDFTIGKLLEDKLNRKVECDKDIEVFNLGIGNYNSNQQLSLFNELRVKLDPD